MVGEFRAILNNPTSGFAPSVVVDAPWFPLEAIGPSQDAVHAGPA
jgi:hypothetical protein